MRQLLYLSRATAACQAQEVGNIVKVARSANEQFQITGALIYDGEYFLQLIEGADEAVGQLLANLLKDPRHTEVNVLFDEQREDRAFAQFSMGYCYQENPSMVQTILQSKADYVAGFVRAFAMTDTH